VRQLDAACLLMMYRSAKPFLSGGQPLPVSTAFIALVRTTLSPRPLGRTVGIGPAARGSTGCTLNLNESKRRIFLLQARTQRSVSAFSASCRII